MIKIISAEDFDKQNLTMSQLVEWFNHHCGEHEKVRPNGWRTKGLGITACKILMKQLDDQIAFEEETDHLSDEEWQKLVMSELEANVEKEAAAPTPKAKAEKLPTQARLASNSEGISASWGEKDTRKARTTRNRVMVNGTEYRSTAAAFNALGLPDSKHIRFRMALKAEGQKDFEHAGEVYHFSIVKGE